MNQVFLKQPNITVFDALVKVQKGDNLYGESYTGLFKRTRKLLKYLDEYEEVGERKVLVVGHETMFYSLLASGVSQDGKGYLDSI